MDMKYLTKTLSIAVCALILTLSAASVLAANRCPVQGANTLQGFAGCLQKIPGGAAIGYGAAGLDRGSVDLLNAMERENGGIPPQVIPQEFPVMYTAGPYVPLPAYYPTSSPTINLYLNAGGGYPSSYWSSWQVRW